MLHEAAKKVKLIRHWIKLAQDQQKSYVDQMSKKLEFGVDKKVYLRINPTKGIVGLGSSGMLPVKYISPFEILECFRYLP